METDMKMDMNVRLCPECGRLIPADEANCEYCGTKLPPANRMAEMRKYAGQYRKLAGDLLREFWADADGGNVMISPLSILLLLAMTADGAKGDTRDEVLEMLGNPEAGEILGWLQKEIARDPAFSSANALCVRQDAAGGIREEYRKRLKQVYQGEIFSSANMAKDVTEWIRKNTRGMIQTEMPETLNRMLLCLLNAVAFEGSWETPYTDYQIGTRDFHNADGTKSRVKMLFGEEYGHVSSRDFNGFVKDYTGDHFRYMALLPRKEGKEALDIAIARLDLNMLGSPVYATEVRTGLPEHRFEFSRELKDILEALGIRKIFGGDADLSAMSTARMPVESMSHRTFIDVDRAGTRAAAVTDYAMAECWEPEKRYEEVYLNRPFVFAICWDTLPIFIGVVSQLEDCGDEEKE